MSWTDEKIELLKKLWAKGLSASQIAKELGDGISRNAVIGKVHRLGLKSRPSPVKSRSGKGKTTAGRRRKTREKQVVRLLDLNDRMCKWPIGHPNEPDFHFCGKPVEPGFPYCTAHCDIAYQTSHRRQRQNPPAS
ncbi:MAG: global cell cycle regulator GcrA-like protein [Alphaproteobacteria bacterium]|nr:MAG: global cell cycle regulator GcrA-like protein [Alphaproteobacteria bacterium]